MENLGSLGHRLQLFEPSVARSWFSQDIEQTILEIHSFRVAEIVHGSPRTSLSESLVQSDRGLLAWESGHQEGV